MNTKELASKLKKQFVASGQVMVGDIVVTKHGCWIVSKVFQEPGGFVSILSENGDGFINIPPCNIIVVINRGCLSLDASVTPE